MLPDILVAAINSGRLFEWIVFLVILEGLLLHWLWRRHAIGLPWHHIIGSFISGACLMLAVRAAVIDAPSAEIALWLALSLIAHLTDLGLRFRRR
jgi:hypothetical protein